MKLFLTIHFKGGLGNQLFQYCNGRYVSEINKIPFLLFNTDNYNNESLDRKFTLQNFKIKGSILKNKRLGNIFKPNTRANKIISSLHLFKELEEEGFTYQELAYQPALFNSISGYWQTEKNFDSIRPTLLKELQPRYIPAYPKWINRAETVAIHIRRTDYLTEPRYGFLGINYYQEAIAYMKEKMQNPFFIVFSDDLKWCKENLEVINMLYFEEKEWSKDFLQLHLISKCEHQIIANSSFSWWGAWLNENPDKMVLRPTHPFKDENLLHEFHYPENWIPIHN